MSNFEIELPNLNVDVSDSINKTLVVLRQSTVSLNRSAIPIQNVAESAITSSYALTASVALNATATLPAGTISSSAQITTLGFVSTSTVPAGTISSSAQLPASIVSSSNQIITLGFITASTISAGTISSSAQLPPSLVSSSNQITALGFISTSINTGSFATTGSNIFVGGQTISSSIQPADINLNVDEADVHIEIYTNEGNETAEYHTYQSYFYNTSSGFFGLAIEDGRAGYSGWTGPLIGGDDGAGGFPAYIGFQDGTNYTDGRVTILTPLSASAGVTASVYATEFVLPTIAPLSPVVGSMYFSGSLIYVYDGLQYRSASLM